MECVSKVNIFGRFYKNMIKVRPITYRIYQSEGRMSRTNSKKIEQDAQNEIK